MKVTGTKADIEAGRGAHITRGLRVKPYEQSCPAALALWRQYGIVAGVCTTVVRVGGAEAALPKRVINRIARYDATKKMTPFAFDLSLVIPGAGGGAT